MPAILVLIIGSLVHLFHYGQPASVVFDEVHNGFYLAHYWTGSYFFDVHPPLAKMIEAFFGYIIGANRLNVDWTQIGNYLPPADVALRLLPIAAGIILPVIVYAICRRLNISKSAAFVAASLICLENSLIVQTRFILYDSFLLVFGFISLLAYLEFVRRQKWRGLFLAVSIVGAISAASVKWTGLSFMLLIFILEAYRIYKPTWLARPTRLAIKKYLTFVAAYIAASLIIYVGIFAVHFKLLPNSSDGNAYMSAQFQKTLAGNSFVEDSTVKPEGFPEKFLELNQVMYEENKTLSSHPYGSAWYTWPLMVRPIFYWQASTTSAQTNSYIYLLGNPFIYWLGALSVFGLLGYALSELVAKLFRREHKFPDIFSDIFPGIFILGGFLVNFIPFIFIGRVMFLYHYEAALIFSIMAIGYALDRFSGRSKYILMGTTLVLALAAFVFWSPLTYGLPLTQSQLSARMWLPSWR